MTHDLLVTSRNRDISSTYEVASELSLIFHKLVINDFANHPVPACSENSHSSGISLFSVYKTL